MNFKLLFKQFVITNLFLFIFCLILFEIPPRIRNKYLNIMNFSNSRCEKIRVNKINFIYGPCKNTKSLRKGDPSDKLLNETISYTDSIGGRVEKKSLGKIFNKEEYKIYLIGDSMIQADELTYNQTVYGIINNQKELNFKKAYGFAYSSWNSKEYLKSIKAIDAYNSSYDIFLGANEFLPSYTRSSYGMLKLQKKDLERNFIDNIEDFLRDKKSRTFQKIEKLYFYINLLINPKENKSFLTSKEDLSCEYLNEYKKAYSNIMFDYITYSLPFKCWEQEHKDSYRLVLDDINKMIIEAKKRNSDIRFIFIPWGFSFKSEHTPGRTHHLYGVPEYRELKLNPLLEKLENDIGDDFINLEKPMSLELSKKDNCKKNNCKNYFYFANDGHLNSNGHNFLFKFLYANK